MIQTIPQDTVLYFYGLFSLAFASVITPGPNNLMLMSSGTNFGYRRTIPHMLGVWWGFPLMCVMVGVGVTRLFDMWPMSYTILQILSVGYMLYLAWKIATAGAPGDGDGANRARPLTFAQAVAFQWVNPKAWGMALSAIGLYAKDHDVPSVMWVAGAYLAMGAISANTWVVIGQQLRQFLSDPLRLRLFNWTMAALLVGSMLYVLLTEAQ